MNDVNARPRGTPGSRPLTPTIILFLVVGGFLLALGLWTADHRNAPGTPADPGPLAIVAPPDSAIVPSPLQITFTTTAPLRLTSAGWQAGQFHLHALVDGTAVMPGASDVQALADERFLWRLGGLAPGIHHVRLVWARPDHESIPEGASDEVVVQVR